MDALPDRPAGGGVGVGQVLPVWALPALPAPSPLGHPSPAAAGPPCFCYCLLIQRFRAMEVFCSVRMARLLWDEPPQTSDILLSLPAAAALSSPCPPVSFFKPGHLMQCERCKAVRCRQWRFVSPGNPVVAAVRRSCLPPLPPFAQTCVFCPVLTPTCSRLFRERSRQLMGLGWRLGGGGLPVGSAAAEGGP